MQSAFENALDLAEHCGLSAVGYIIVAAPFQNPMDSVEDLLYLASLRTLAGVSVFYPSPGSVDYDLCSQLGILPEHLSLMRSSALPVSHTTSRIESVTLMRLGRLLNFMKALTDQKIDFKANDSGQFRQELDFGTPPGIRHPAFADVPDRRKYPGNHPGWQDLRTRCFPRIDPTIQGWTVINRSKRGYGITRLFPPS